VNRPDVVPAVETVVTRAAETFEEMLQRYRPWYRPEYAEQHSGNTERNLSFQITLSFCAIYGKLAFAAMEVPLRSKRNVYEDHLDAYLYSPQLAILLECKVHSGNESLEGVAADIERMAPAVLDQVRKRHQGPDPSEARETVAMVLVEAWGRDDSCLKWWRDEAERAKRAHGKLPADCHFDGKKILETSARSDGTLYWLYAYRHLGLTL
jgi:hypothetical protein